MLNNVLSVILGGGAGTRLRPLTSYRSKPAVPLGGKYRIIDIPISNCLNSGLNRIYLLTQYNSVSLHRHVRQTYRFDRFSSGFVEILAAQQTIEGEEWYQGTADAVRKNLRYVQQHGVDYVLVLSGDQIYRMNFEEMLRTHREHDAEVTIAALPVDEEKAKAFGIMRIDDSGRVKGFVEKPQTPEAVDPVRMDPAWLNAHGIDSRGRDCLASMGIYLFDRDVLVDLLTKYEDEDFGKQVFPRAIDLCEVQVHPFDGYWEDIGTIRSFYEANIEMAGENPPFHFYVDGAPIYTRARQLPSTRFAGAAVTDSLVADGCRLGRGAVVENSIVGLRCRIGENVTIRNSVLMGLDYFESPEEIAADEAAGRPPMGIGAGTVIEGAIVDKDCHIGKNVTLRHTGAQPPADSGVTVVDDVIVVQKGTVLPDGWSL